MIHQHRTTMNFLKIYQETELDILQKQDIILQYKQLNSRSIFIKIVSIILLFDADPDT